MIDIDAVLERIHGGESQLAIAASLRISTGRLSELLNAPDVAERSARAREDSAESWLDKGLAVIESALDKTGNIDASAAKAYAQECARRAAIRNPKYRDKVQTEVTGANGGPIVIASKHDESI